MQTILRPLVKSMQTSIRNFTFMGLCIVNVFKCSQQDATLHNSIYYYTCSTCFRQFLCPLSGAQNCIHSIRYLSSFFCFLPLSWVSWNNGKRQKSLTNTRCCLYSIELLMMGGGTAWNMQSIYSNKYYCVTLHLVGYAWISISKLRSESFYV
jgi:hypothetical protein